HAALRVDGVHRTGAIAYERDVARRTVHVDASDRDRRAHGGSSREVPVDAASRGVERVDVAALAADEHAAADNGRLSISSDVPWKSERPFELHSRHLSRRDPGTPSILK